MKPAFPYSCTFLLGSLLLLLLSAILPPIRPLPAQDENSKTTEAADAAAAKGGPNMTLTAAEVRFVKEAGGGNLAEVKLGELAQARGESPEVKSFGQTMTADHGKANAELGAVAGKKGMPFEPTIDPRNEALYERLSKMSGTAFDKAYVDTMARDHAQDVNEYETAAREGKDEDLKKYAADTLPVIQHHLQMVNDLKDKVGPKEKSEAD